MIIFDLIYNLTLLVALSVVSGFIDLRWERSTRQGRLLQGLLFGGAAMIAMLRPLDMGGGLIFDGRSVVISLCGLFFGPLAAGLAGGLTLILRVALGGSGALMGVLVILESAVIGVIFHRRWQALKYDFPAVQLWQFGLLVHLIMLALTFTLPNNSGPGVLATIGLPVILTYPLATILIGKILSDQAGHSRYLTELQRSEERFRTVADFTYDWEYWSAPDGHIIYMSPSCERVTGYHVDEFEREPGLLLSIVHPDDQPVFAGHLTTQPENMDDQKVLDLRIVTRSGEERWIAHSSRSVYGRAGEYLGRRVSNRDITDRKQAEAAVRQERQLLRSVVDNLPDAVYIKDAQLRKVLANQADVDSVGALSVDDILGKTDWELYPPEVAEQFTADDRTVLETGQPILNHEELLVNVHGQQRWLLTSKLALRDADGRINGILGIGRDITDRKRLEQVLAAERDLLEQRVAERTRELAAANDRLQDLDRLKNKFVSDVSHELRTPVTSLLLYLDLLEHGKPEKRAHYLLSANEQARRMQQLIENILDLSRLERETDRPFFEPIDLNAVLERVVLAQQPRAEAAGLRLVLEAAPDLPQVRGDVNHLLQVMTNLVANAISYTPVGSIHVVSRAQARQVIVEVRDTGMGIAPEDLPHLFDRFYRGRLTRHITGTGLGLAIVNEIVVAHGGHIEVSSEVGVGSTFRVCLPCDP